jgi:lipoate-protein ligase B
MRAADWETCILEDAAHRSLVIHQPETPYGKALALQHRLVSAKSSGNMDEDVLLLLEHPPVFTLGRRGGKEHLGVSETWLHERGIAMHRTERGGYITYHGPGQIVGYPIFDLGRMGIGVADFVHGLEEVMIRTTARWNVSASRDGMNRGIWAGGRKLGSIGLAVRRGISFHGFALNANVDLTPFQWITPCGLPDVEMTSLKLEHGKPIGMEALRESVQQDFEDVFGISLKKNDLASLTSKMPPGSNFSSNGV